MIRHPSTLKAPFVMSICAPRNSGKSFLLVNLLIQEQFYRNMFHKVYVFCPSFHLDKKYLHLNLPSDQIFTEYSNESLQNIIDNANPKHQTLIVLDDCMTEKDFKSNNTDNPLNMLSIRGRHLNISVIVSIQKTSGSSTALRANSDGIIVFKPRSLNETKSIYDDNAINNLSFNDFKALLNKYTREQYSFLYVNYQQNKVYDRNFKEID